MGGAGSRSQLAFCSLVPGSSFPQTSVFKDHLEILLDSVLRGQTGHGTLKFCLLGDGCWSTIDKQEIKHSNSASGISDCSIKNSSYESDVLSISADVASS